MIRLEDNRGFNCCELIENREQQLRIGIIDADLLDNGTRHPNLALFKISGYCKHFDHSVRLVQTYKEISTGMFVDEDAFDLLVMSKVFKFTKTPEFVNYMIEQHMICYGGTGFFEINGPSLPTKVEHFLPDYHLYDDFIEWKTAGDAMKKKRNWDDYISYSIGFTTRGCIRHCGFCVNRLLNRVDEWSPVEEFLDSSPAICKPLLQQLTDTKQPFQFHQGLDERMLAENPCGQEMAEILSHARCHGDFIFAFENWRDRETIEKALIICKHYNTKNGTKFYHWNVRYHGASNKTKKGIFVFVG